jgi:hypothetical protein
MGSPPLPLYTIPSLGLTLRTLPASPLSLYIVMAMLSNRLYSILALIIYVILGVPVWFYLTRIHRPPLPHAQMQSINATFHLPIEISLILPLKQYEMHGTSLSPFFWDKLQHLGISRLTSMSRPYENEDLVTSLISMADDQADEALQSYVASKLKGRRGSYYLFILPLIIPQSGGDDGVMLTRLVIGKYRHAVLRADCSRLMEALTASCPSLASTLLSTLSPLTQPPLSAAGEAVLSFSLYNAKSHPSSSYATWDFPAFEDLYLSRFIGALSGASIRIQSQSQVVLFGEPSRIKGPWSEERGAHIIRESKLTEWMSSWTSLDSGSLGSSLRSMIPPYLVHFVAYVPPYDQQPLCIVTKAKQSAGSSECRKDFFVPSWGGVHLINPNGSRNESGHWHLSVDMNKQMARSFITQLRALLGLPSPTSYLTDAKSIHLSLLLSPSQGISEWEVDSLTRQRVVQNQESVAKVLRSLSLTVEQIPQLEMPDEIGSVVAEALVLIENIRSSGDDSEYDSVAQWAQEASGLAEQAFSNPAVLAQLSHPESHDLGVYVPLFLPLAITITAAFMREIKYLRKQRAVEVKDKVD